MQTMKNLSWLKYPALGLAVTMIAGCVNTEQIREAIPFFPPSKYVTVGGRRLTKSEVAYYQRIRDLSYATKVNPRDAVAYNELGLLFQQKGNYQLAKDLYYKATDIDDNLSEPHHNLGLISLYEGRYNTAIEHLTKAKKLSPDDARIRHRLGQAKAGLDQINEALKEYDEAIALDSEYIPAQLEKGRLLYSVRRYADATATCRAALTNSPKVQTTLMARETRGTGILDNFLPTGQEEVKSRDYKPEILFNLAICLKAQGQFSEALSAIVEAEPLTLKTADGYADVEILKARLQEASGDTGGAIATLDLLRKDKNLMAEIPKRLARLYQKNGQTDLAAKTRLEAAELDHSDRELQEEAARNAEQTQNKSGAIAIYERLVRLDPEEVRYRRQLAQAYDNMGILRSAAMAYQEIVNRVPDDVATRRRLGMLYAELPGFQGSAILQLKQVLEKNPRDPEVNRRMGELYLFARNFNEAERYIQLTLAVAPRDAKALNNLGELLRKQNRFDDAVEKYKQALASDPKLFVAQLNLAEVLISLSRKEEAILPLRTYLANKPLEEEALRLLADTLRDLGRREEAMKEYEAIQALKPREAGALMELAQLQKGIGKPRSSAGLYEAILEKQPTNIPALREAGRLYDELKMPLRAIFCWQRVLSLKPGDLESQTHLAECYKKIGSEDAALLAYEAVGKSGDADAWRNAATLHLKRDEQEKARQALREAIKIRPQEIDTRRQLAGLMQNGKTPEEKDEAIELYKTILELESADERSRLNLANLYSEANRLADAQDQYDVILKEKPEHTASLVGMGVVWRKRGKYEKALDCYHRALKTDESLKIAHYNMGLIYDYYLSDKIKAQIHYDRFVQLGGDVAKLPADRGGRRSPADLRTQGRETSIK